MNLSDTRKYEASTFIHSRFRRSIRLTPRAAGVLALAFLLVQLPMGTLVQPASAATQVTLYVSPAGSDATGNGSAALPYQTITHAVSVSPAGTIVLVEPGTYHEMVNITTTITLRSLSADFADTIIDASGLSMGVMISGSGAAGTVVEGFTVENANNHGIYAQDTSGVLILSNLVTNNGLSPNSKFSGEDKALQLTGTSYSVVAHNTVEGNQYGGIALTDDGPINPGFYSPGESNPSLGNLVSGNTVINNRPHHCSVVLSAYNSGEGVIDNIVSDNSVIDNSAGIVVAADTPNTDVFDNSVVFNTVLNNGEGGVIVHSNAPGDNVTGTLIVGNTFSANGYPVAFGPEMPDLPAVLLGGEGSVPVHDTVVSGNIFHSEHYAVYVVNATGTSVFDNEIDQSVTVPIFGGTMSEAPMTAEVDELSSGLSTMQSSLSQLKSSAASSSDLSTLSGTVSSLSATVSGLQSSSAKQSDVSALTNSVNTVSGNVNSVVSSTALTSYVAYAALALAIVLLGLDVALFRRRPAAA